jgi:hypothetical protein
MIVSRLQPYKLASQVVGENYLELADYLRIKAKYYTKILILMLCLISLFLSRSKSKIIRKIREIVLKPANC